ncbi:MAG: aminotransferase class I/II-fold pyridoxal phosphate-dependent enzyme [Acidimicrobiales bacterium]|nr:aminotransferase class I/II-fold pyridoxal phosphate-dependent enzyme [Acidimicrobiales bacterium]RZV47625.1 MAG: aminotransferase class I/II-fold pyridoxal phosphate-dependent enzyme [Acidimicrobiales bacterium]
MIDMSIGAPADPPPQVILDAMVGSDSERGYPPSIGSPAFRTAAASWFDRRVGVTIDPAHIGATIGLKEFVAGVPHWLRHRDPSKDTVLYPAVSYPSYAMGAELAHCRAVPVAVDSDWRMDVSSIDPADAARAVCLWVNSPGNPAGALEDLAAAAEWGRAHGVPVISDECYIEFIWDGPPKTILQSGQDGVLAIHSLSKRSNFAGARAGFYAGDPELVLWLQELRKHLGFMVPGPIQAAAAAALNDDDHVEVQRERYRHRLETMSAILGEMGIRAPMPGGGFYLWAEAPDGDAWALADRLANELGVICSPGEFYGEAGSGHARFALVVNEEQLETVRSRLS